MARKPSRSMLDGGSEKNLKGPAEAAAGEPVL
jgi:hypothetical protein